MPVRLRVTRVRRSGEVCTEVEGDATQGEAARVHEIASPDTNVNHVASITRREPECHSGGPAGEHLVHASAPTVTAYWQTAGRAAFAAPACAHNRQNRVSGARVISGPCSRRRRSRSDLLGRAEDGRRNPNVRWAYPRSVASKPVRRQAVGSRGRSDSRIASSLTSSSSVLSLHRRQSVAEFAALRRCARCRRARRR